VRARVRAELGLATEQPLFATVAMLRPGKGLRYLVEAAALVRQQAPDAGFVVIGDGAQRPELENLAARLGVSDEVQFLGTRTDVPALLAAADVFVLPSLYEALPTSLLEAMATALPVVATRVGGVPEVVAHERTGLLVSPASAAELAAAMTRLDSPARVAMGAAGRAWVESHASLGVWLDGLQDLYRRVVASGVLAPA